MGSENGWEPPRLAPGDPLLIWKTVPGTNVTLQVMRGLPEVFLPAWAADWNAYIEPLRDADSASYTPTNSVATSNHLNGTACDLDWDSHPFQKRGSLNAAQMATMAEMEAFYEGWMFWAGRWDDPVDEMHSQMGYNTWNRNTAAFDFIARKIRSDGFSTFRRGALTATDPPKAGQAPGAPTPVTPDNPTRDGHPPVDGPAEVLYDAVPEFGEDDAARLAPLIVPALAASECTTVPAIAMWLAQWGHESGGFVYTQEIKPPPGAQYPPYIGRTWAQITWQSNYQKFGQWCADRGLLNDPNSFVNDPPSLADTKWEALGCSWYWTTQRPINDLIAAGDDAEWNGYTGAMSAVTAAINGGQNGLQNRIDRYQQAIALGDRLLQLIAPATTAPDQGDDFMSELTPAEQRELYDNTKWLREQMDVSIWGPSSSMGTTVAADGTTHELTVRDGLAEEKRAVEKLLELLTKPGVAVVVLQAAAPAVTP